MNRRNRGIRGRLVPVVIGIVLAAATPAFAQSGGYPYIELSMGYGNLGFPNPDGSTGRHSGFSSQQNINLTRWFGIDNYVGYYSMGNDTNAFSNVIGGKLSARRASGITPYGVAGIGWSRITVEEFGLAGSMLTTRAGGGVDIPLNPALGLRLDVSRMWFHTGDITGTGSNWSSGTNFAGGLVFVLQ
jgi:hypothetical protein